MKKSPPIRFLHRLMRRGFDMAVSILRIIKHSSSLCLARKGMRVRLLATMTVGACSSEEEAFNVNDT